MFENGSGSALHGHLRIEALYKLSIQQVIALPSARVWSSSEWLRLAPSARFQLDEKDKTGLLSLKV